MGREDCSSPLGPTTSDKGLLCFTHLEKTTIGPFLGPKLFLEHVILKIIETLKAK